MKPFTFSQVFSATPACFHQCYLSGSSSFRCCFIHSRHFLVSICSVNIKPRTEEKNTSLPNKRAGVEMFVLDFTSTEQYGTGRVESLAGLWLPR